MEPTNSDHLVYQPHSASEHRLLRMVARAWGIQPSYQSIQGDTIWAPVTSLVKVLQDLSGEQISDLHSLKAVFRKKIELSKKDLIAPVQVHWCGEKNFIRLHLSPYAEPSLAKVTFSYEQGGSLVREISPENFQIRKNDRIMRMDIPMDEIEIPSGYHEVQVVMGDYRGRALYICAPKKIERRDQKKWGAFFPLYGLKSSKSWGVGSLSEMGRAWDLFKAQGADFVGTLPLLATNLDHPDCDPSPYSALSRLFWNEIYIDLEALLKKYDVDEINELARSEEIQAERKRLEGLSEVDYFSSYQLKKRILLLLSEHFFDEGYDESQEFEDFTEEFPEVWDYATFRSDNSREQRFHVFCQFHMSRGLHKLCDQKGARLYLDYPVGVSEAGFDNFQFKELFLNTVSVGAPPDPLAEQGQNWGFAALNPVELQKDKYRYFRKSLQNHFRFCKVLRIDHIMGFYRLYVIPKGSSGKEGLYLKYPAKELFAVACLEAEKAGADIIGEDLGTVPHAVREILNQHDINGMWIFQFEATQPSWARREPQASTLAGFNTHDTPTFKAWIEGEDLKLLSHLGFIEEHRVGEIHAQRRQQLQNWKESEIEGADFGIDDSDAMMLCSLDYLCKTQARYVLVNVEDLWGETKPQNVPGTWKEYPNWRKKLALSVDEWREHALFNKALEVLRRR